MDKLTNWVTSRPCGIGAKQRSYHAEEQVIRQKNISKCKTIVSIRISNGKFMNSKPCESCRRKCLLAGFTHTYYHDNNGILQYNSLSDLNSKWSGGRRRR